MKVASFIIATLLIPFYPTNLVITTRPRTIEVRFRPPPVITYIQLRPCSLALGLVPSPLVVAGSPRACASAFLPPIAKKIDTTPLIFFPLFQRTTPTDGPSGGATQGQQHAPASMQPDDVAARALRSPPSTHQGAHNDQSTVQQDRSRRTGCGPMTSSRTCSAGLRPGPSDRVLLRRPTGDETEVDRSGPNWTEVDR